MKVYDSTAINDLMSKAEIHPRLRQASALKEASYNGVRPLLNAMLPGTYIQPHRHNPENADEYWFVLRGDIASFSFSEEGDVKDHKIVSSQNGFPLAFLPRGEYHTLVVVDKPAVILELTQGPYDALTYKEFAPWAPSESPEDQEKAREYLRGLEAQLK